MLDSSNLLISFPLLLQQMSLFQKTNSHCRLCKGALSKLITFIFFQLLEHSFIYLLFVLPGFIHSETQDAVHFECRCIKFYTHH